MVYPIIPLTLSWNNEITETPNITISKYGENGVSRRSYKGINNISHTINVSVRIKNWQQLDTFLKARRNLPFRLSHNGGLSDDGYLYMCKDWNFSILGKDIAEFTADFIEIKRFT